ncbi:LYR motif-containing protein 2 [Onthophagus taurus]|uniref:LYR motif-containing protein 2 n=1 Tax=Onthophagus taurus TaxID=166361 RepID=UPI0039BEA915
MSGKRIMNLKQFMLRQQVLRLYRRILRTIKEVPDKTHQKELLDWARSDFKNNSHHTDEVTIKMMITYGERSLKELESSLALAK